MPSSTFKMLEATEYTKLLEPVFDCDVTRARVINFSDTLRRWSCYLGYFLEYQMLQVSSNPSDNSLRTVRMPDPRAPHRPFEKEDVWIRLLAKGYPKVTGRDIDAWRTDYIFTDSNKVIRGALITGRLLSKEVDGKQDHHHIYQRELLALLVCLSQQEKYLSGQDTPATLSAFVISCGTFLRIVEAQLISPNEIRFILRNDTDMDSTGPLEVYKTVTMALSTPIE